MTKRSPAAGIAAVGRALSLCGQQGSAGDVPVMPGGHPVLGHALAFGRDPLALFEQAREHGDVVLVRFGPFRAYVLNSPDAIRQALVGEARKLGKGLNFGRAKRLIGNGLVMSEGESHRLQRRLMQPAFHRSQIAGYVATMTDTAVPRIDAWPDGGTLAFDQEMRSITLTVLTRTLLSSDIDAEAIDEIERLLRVLLAELVARGIAANVPWLAWVPTASNRRFSSAHRRLGGLLTELIDGYRKADADRGDLISILMRARDDDTGARIERPAAPRRGDDPRHRRFRDDRQRHRLGLLPAGQAAADPGTTAAGGRSGTRRRRCRIRGPEQASLHPCGDHRGAAAVQPRLDPAPPGTRRR